MDINKHTESYLDYYCKLNSPEYAVLIKGEWGAGKTWFIKKYCSKLKKKKKKVIYVSLYGMSSYSQIEDAFFQQLHPILASKTMSVAGKLLKGALRTTLKVDFKEDSLAGSVNTQLPEVKIPECLKNVEQSILVFDDLERSGFEVELLLGYINYFVEHQGLRVILLANEKELDKTNEKYKRVKEKLVGKTFEIMADIDEAMNVFVKKIPTVTVRNFLKENNNTIKEVYKNSTYHNLRHLKQALWDFDRLYLSLPDSSKSNKNLLLHILQLLLAFSFEIRHGNLTAKDIEKMKEEYWSTIGSNEKKKTTTGILFEKYVNINFMELVLGKKCWIDFFDKNLLNKDEIDEAVKNSSYYQNENTPSWIKLWHFRDLNDDEFETVLNEVLIQYKAKEFKEIGEIKHIFGMLLYFSKNGIYKELKNSIIKNCEEYVEYLKKEGLLPKKDLYLLERNAYAGLGFFEDDSEDFIKMSEFIKKKTEEARIENMPNAGKELLEMMINDPSKFREMLCAWESEKITYYKMPILKYINPKTFVEKLICTDATYRISIIQTFTERYKHEDIAIELLTELEWLKEITTNLRREIKKLKGKLSGFMLESAIKYHFEKIINKLEAIKIKLEEKNINSK